MIVAADERLRNSKTVSRQKRARRRTPPWEWARPASIVVLTAGLMVLGCRRPVPETEQAAVEQDRVVGCWELDVTPGDTADDSVPSWLAGAGLPTKLALDSTVVSAGGEGSGPIYEAHSYHGIRRESLPFSAWRRLSGDSILVDRPGALAGFTLRLAPDDGGLSGLLSSFTDAVQPGQPSRRTTPVRATPATCPDDGSGAGASADR